MRKIIRKNVPNEDHSQSFGFEKHHHAEAYSDVKKGSVAVMIKLPPGRAQEMIMQELVLRLYQEQIISSGQGAFLRKMNRTDFERFLSSESSPFHCNPGELDQDISDLENAA